MDYSKTLIIIQARMNSSRLYGKSMKLINGQPLLNYLINSIKFVLPNVKIIIATSTSKDNDVIRDFATKMGYESFSGDEQNVASRFLEILKLYPEMDYFMRFCADAPILDVDLLKNGTLILQENEKIDFITSIGINGYPMGSNIEIFKCSLFVDNYLKFNKLVDLEHVTQFFYRNKECFNHILINCRDLRSENITYKLSVDTLDDFDKINYLLFRMNYRPWDFTLEEKFNMVEDYFSIKIKN